MFYIAQTIFKIMIPVSVILVCTFHAMADTSAGFYVVSGEKDIRSLRKKSQTIQEQIEQDKKKVDSLKKDEKSTLRELNDTDYELSTLRKQLASTRNQMDALEKKIEEAKKQSAALTEQIRKNESYATERLVALYKLNSLGRMTFFASADSVHEFFYRQKALERILELDDQLLRTYAQNQIELKQTLKDLESRKSEKEVLEKDYQNQAQTLSQQRKQRSKLLKKIQSEKSLTLASINALNQSAKNLDQKIEELKKIATYKPPPRLSPEPKGGKWATGNSFRQFKGLLKMPVRGKIISVFGPYRNTEFNVLNFQSGIDIQANRGDPVHAVGDGKVLYSSWFKGYGNLIIIDHGDNYYTLYAHADQLLKSIGEHVNAGEVVATVGDTGSLEGAKLHFEIRHHGKPVDPMKWLKKG